jgi:hypothetical protein
MIQPEPTGEEAATILAVLRLLRRARPAASTPVAQRLSPWQRAARREVLRTQLPHEAGGWDRAARGG